MPDGKYVSGFNPPRYRDRLYAHPFSTSTGIFWFLMGLVFTAEGFSENYISSSSVSRFNDIASAIIGIFFMTSSVLLLWTLYTRTEKLNIVYLVGKLSCTMSIFAGGAYAFLVTLYSPFDLLALFLGAGTSMAGFFGLVSIIETEKRTRALMELGGKSNES